MGKGCGRATGRGCRVADVDPGEGGLETGGWWGGGVRGYGQRFVGGRGVVVWRGEVTGGGGGLGAPRGGDRSQGGVGGPGVCAGHTWWTQWGWRHRPQG